MDSFVHLTVKQLVSEGTVTVGDSDLSASTSAFSADQDSVRACNFEARITYPNSQPVVVIQCGSAVSHVFGRNEWEALLNLREFGLAALTDAVPVKNPTREIGRASCRERVCQYV